MHNLHLVSVKADNGKDACQIVESALTDWGNENNWRSILGAIDRNNNITDHEKTALTESKMTVERAERMVKDWMNSFYLQEHIPQLMQRINQIDQFSLYDWNLLEDYARYKQETISNPEPELFDIWENEFYSYQLDYCGLTNLHIDGRNQYLVFIDMHS